MPQAIHRGIKALVDEANAEIETLSATDAILAAQSDDVVIVDIRMPPTHTDDGLRAAHYIHAAHPSVGVLVLSQYIDTGYTLTLLSQGAKGLGYLLKDRLSDLQELTEAIHRVGTGGSVIDPEVVARLLERRRQHNPLDALTERECSVLELMAQGRSNQAISDRLFLSTKTVEAHIRNIFTKLDLSASEGDHRRVLAVLRFLERASPTV